MHGGFRSLVLAAALALPSVPAAAADLRIGLGLEPTSIDPHYHNLGPNSSFSRHVFDRLIHQDENQKLQPALALSWKAIQDTVWEFKLRPGVTWHDGSPFTVDDVLFTMQRLPNVPNSPSSFALYVKGKTFIKVDDLTLHVKTESPYPLMPTDISALIIVSKKHAENASTDNFTQGKAAGGTGPYRPVEWVPGDRIVVEANKAYWGDKPRWDKVIFKPIETGTGRVAALLAGDVDLIDVVPTTDIANLKNDRRVSVSSGISNRVMYLHMEQEKDEPPLVTDKAGKPLAKNPFKDLRVRQAISKAINRPAIVERVMEGVSVASGQLLPPGFFAVSPNLKVEPYDPQGAKKLLAEAGYPDGFVTVLATPNGRYVNDVQVAETLAQMLSRVGIETKVEQMPPAVFFTRATKRDFPFISLGWGSETGEASSPLKALFATFDRDTGMGAANRGRYSNPKLDAMLSEALRTVDDAKREKILIAATDLAIGDLGIIPLHFQVNSWATRAAYKYVPRTDEYTLADFVVPAK